MRRTRMLLRLVALLSLVVGATLLLFPHIGQALYHQTALEEVRRFEAGIAATQEELPDFLATLRLACDGYNRQLYESGQKSLTDPFSWEQPGFSLQAYGFSQEMIGYLSIPKLDLLLPIYLGATGENMKRGAAHLTETSLPVGGVNTNTVLGAHRGMRTADMLKDIEELTEGDLVLVTNPFETLTYRVDSVAIISPNQPDPIRIQEGRDMVTLLTCHPYGKNSHRYLVYCERTSA